MAGPGANDDDTLLAHASAPTRPSAPTLPAGDAASAATAISGTSSVVIRRQGAAHERVILDPRRYEIRGELARGGMGRWRSARTRRSAGRSPSRRSWTRRPSSSPGSIASSR